MTEVIACDICVIGAGSGGLSVAAGASLMGARTVLIERAHMGGDCLNFGCVPSKALLAAARLAAQGRRGRAMGVNLGEAAVDFPRVIDHVKAVIAAIAPHDSVERFEGLGVTVILGAARFTGPREVAVGDRLVRARRFVIATGSAPVLPPVEGLAQVPHFTNETLFDNRVLPAHLLILGGGPIGLEMAQAHRRLGAKVTVIEMLRALGREDAELAAVVIHRLRAEGVEILEGTRVDKAEASAGGIALTLSDAQGRRRVEGSHLLVAAGRQANVANLGLEAAGVAYNPKGVKVDAGLRSTNKHVYAVGDAAGGAQFTHLAGYHAGIVLRRALFRLPAKANPDIIPWATYTDPELAYVGLDEGRAREKFAPITILRWPYADNDRAQAERETDGLVKVITTRRGRILGAGIVGAHAGELIQPWVLAVSQKMKIGAMAGMVAPYPTFGEVNKRAAGSFFTRKLFGPATRRIVRFLARFG
jgi:pyruvate/2-oxoglutarate dehydrogenase complex dihydrolipoamide dehydrogenase (E3) component